VDCAQAVHQSGDRTYCLLELKVSVEEKVKRQAEKGGDKEMEQKFEQVAEHLYKQFSDR